MWSFASALQNRVRHLASAALLLTPWLASDATTLLPQPVHLENDGIVHDVITLSDGSAIIAGRFQLVNGVERRNIARLRPDGTVDPGWRIDVNAAIQSIVASDDTLYLAGDFWQVQGVRRVRLAAIDIASGDLRPWSPEANGAVRQLALASGRVYLAGAFGTLNGLARSQQGAVDAVSGETLAWNPDIDSSVSEMIATPSVVYLAIDVSPNVVALDVIQGQPTSFAAAVEGDVLDLALTPEGLYIVGAFSTVNAAERPGIALLDAVTGELEPWTPQPIGERRGSIDSIAVTDGAIHLAGHFSDAQGSFAFGALRRTSGERLPWSPPIADDDDASFDLIAWRGGILVHGQFAIDAAPVQRGIAFLDAVTGNALSPALDAARGGWGYALAYDDEGRLYIGGGAFDAVASERRSNFVRLDAGGALDLAFGSDVFISMFRIVPAGSRVVVLNPTAISGRGTFGMVDAGTGAPLPPLDEQAWVTEAVVHGDELFAYGSLTLGGQSRSGLFALSLPTTTFTDWTTSAGEVATHLVVDGDRLLYATFFSPDGTYDVHAANMKTGAVSVASLHVDRPIEHIAVDETGVYIAGDFTTVAGEPRARIAKLSRNTLSLMPWQATVPHYIGDIASDGDVLFVAGDVGLPLPCAQTYLCQFDTRSGEMSADQAMVDFFVSDVDVSRGAVAITGQFQRVDDSVRLGLARFERRLFRDGME